MDAGVFSAVDHTAVQQGGEESLVEELLGHHQEDEKGDGSRQKKGTMKVRSNPHLCGLF